MKKTGLLAVAATMFMATACTSSTKAPKPEFDNQVDTLTYALGKAQAKSLKEYMKRGLNVDSAYTKEFIQGVMAGINGQSASDKAFNQGVQIGQRFANMPEGVKSQLFHNDSTINVKSNNIYGGLIEGLQDEAGVMTVEEAVTYVEKRIKEMREEESLKKFGKNKEEGEKFLAENKTKKGIHVTPSGLQYQIIKKGRGEKPTDKARVEVKYKGTLIDGTVFDDSTKHGGTSTFGVDQVVKGWTEALKMMPVGSKWKLFIPQELAYGSRNQGKIKPFSTLIFELELIKIKK